MSPSDDESLALSARFWADGGRRPLLMLNPRQPFPGEMALRNWLDAQRMLYDHVLFRTSGSEGRAKCVCLSKNALLASAAMVNRHLGTHAGDRWLVSLPTFHVGGYSIVVRASLAAVPVEFLRGKWSPKRFVDTVRVAKATLTSLVPTQVHDLVSRRCRCPESLRFVLLGGGALSERLWEQALDLGWPLLGTYGMTETASQVATQTPISGNRTAWLEILPGWQTRVNASGCLEVKGAALFDGYVIEEPNLTFRWVDPRVDGWFQTRDRVDLREGLLRFLGRDAHTLKIKGELVSLSAIRLRLEELACAAGLDPLSITVVAMDDLRDEQRLVAVVGGEMKAEAVESLLADCNHSVAPFEQVHHWKRLVSIPRTSLGKIDEANLAVKLMFV